MTNMFPTMYRGGQDPDDHRSHSDHDVARPPTALRWGYLLMLASTMFMLVAGLIIATAGYTGDPNVDPRFAEAVVLNQRIVGICNIVAAMVLVLLSVQVRNGARKVRPWVVGVVVLVVLVDMIAFLIKAGGFAVALIPVMLATSAVLLYRDSVTLHLDYLSERR
ncbi:hypothetical protein [Corynebacterium epidermidicanis]|uniref:Uncharacterized protein n=1 Tax=Corynebacterium epidermidicanis TaxID=1050174 RepID=A0A0G3GSD2_9CORY|nr:hypothetical protein [Corynebacterium epidermidicanis]AKK04044.1 hypothetical protein CEPID_11075 [Corynebacterium epidermidicanis]